RSHTEDEQPHELTQGATRTALADVGVRRVPADGCGGELCRGRGAREDDQYRRRLDVADDDELEQVPGGVEPEAEAPREREEHDRRAEQTDREEREPRERVRALHLRQPEPDV